MNRSQLVLASLTLALVTTLTAQPPAGPKPAVPPSNNRVSPHETTYARVGTDRNASLITIIYGRPYSKDPKSGEIRKIWGGLVKWDKAERMGADEATTILTHQSLVFGATTIPAGVYTLYIVPSENGTSKLAFSSHVAKWGIPVDETHDVARIDLKKDTLETQLDQLQIGIETNPPAGGTLVIAWEKTKFSAAFTTAK
jgi:hypothetical protein